MSLLREIVEESDPALRPYAAADPPAGRFEEGPPEGNRRFVLEAVYEGFLLHYGVPRAFEGMDRDLCLLAGDALYALGLSRLAEEGDLEAVEELSDLISLSAWAESEGRRELSEELWPATADRLSPKGGPGAREAVLHRLAPKA